jgi:hypothetical protein
MFEEKRGSTGHVRRAAMPWHVFLCATRYTFIAGSYFAQMQDPKLQRENDFSRSDLDLLFGQTGGRM